MKEYPASDSRLAELRASGVFPRSGAVLTLGAVLGAGVSFLLVRELTPSMEHLIAEGSDPGRLLEITLSVLLFTIPVALSTTFFGLLQSRFAIYSPWGESDAEHLPIYERAAIVLSVLGIFALVFGAEIYRAHPDYSTTPGLQFLRHVYGISVGVSVVLAILSYASCWLRFRLHHRMSRVELNAEAQEGQMRSDVRGMTQR